MRTTFLLLTPLLILACGGRSETETFDPGDGDGRIASTGGGSPSGNSSGGAQNGGNSQGGVTAAGGAFTGVGGSTLAPTGGTTGAGGSAAMGGAGLIDAETFCMETCERVTPDSGGCGEAMACAEGGECLARAELWNAAAREAFAICLETNPLCFVTAEGCMLEQVFEDIPYRIVVEGHDFDFPEGTTVGLATTQDSQTGPLSGGSFSLSASAEGFVDHPDPVLVWIDASEDGSCGEGDWMTFITAAFNGDFEEPLFVQEVAFEDFVQNPNLCSSFL